MCTWLLVFVIYIYIHIQSGANPPPPPVICNTFNTNYDFCLCVYIHRICLFILIHICGMNLYDYIIPYIHIYVCAYPYIRDTGKYKSSLLWSIHVNTNKNELMGVGCICLHLECMDMHTCVHVFRV